MTLAATEQLAAISVSYDDSYWAATTASTQSHDDEGEASGHATIYRGSFDRPDLANRAVARLLVRGHANALIYLNGTVCEQNAEQSQERSIAIDLASLRDVNNVIAIVDEEPRPSRDQFDGSSPAVVKVREPARSWKRSLFNGLAQVIVQSTTESGEIKMIAKAPGLKEAVAVISSQR